jgi:hypothetical protein
MMIMGCSLVMVSVPYTLYIKIGYSVYTVAMGWAITAGYCFILPAWIVSVAQVVYLNFTAAQARKNTRAEDRASKGLGVLPVTVGAAGSFSDNRSSDYPGGPEL